MKILDFKVIHDDNDVNIAGKQCIFYCTTKSAHHPLDGVYGVSSAEMDVKDVYYDYQHHYILGIYDNNMITNILTGEKISIDKIQLQNVKLLDYGKLHQFFKSIIEDRLLK